MLKEDFIRNSLKKHEELFDKYLSKIMENKLNFPSSNNPPYMKETESFYLERKIDLPMYVEKIYNFINEGELKYLINEEDRDTFIINSDGSHTYEVRTSDNQIICVLILENSIRKDFDSPTSSYSMCVKLGSCEISSNEIKIIPYKNSYKKFFTEESKEKYANKINILLSYCSVLGLKLEDIAFRTVKLKDVKDKELQERQDVGLFAIFSNYIGADLEIENDGKTLDRYVFETFKEELRTNYKIKTFKHFKIFLEKVRGIESFLKLNVSQDISFRFKNGDDPRMCRTKNIIEFINLEDNIDFHIVFEINDDLASFNEKFLFIGGKNGNINDYKSSNLKLKDYIEDKENLIKYLKLLNY